MMTMVSEVEAAPTMNPSALSGVRFLVTKRIEDLDATAAALDDELSAVALRLQELRAAQHEAEGRWGALLSVLPAGDVDEIDSAFRTLAKVRADLAATEERQVELGTRLTGMRAEQEVLRAVYRSLDDLLAAHAGPTNGTARLRDASRQTFQIIEEERMRIARDMHDGPAQSMANLVLQAEIIERLIARDPKMVVSELADFKNGVRSVLDDTRRLIFDLRPMTLDDLGLVPTLRKFVAEFGEKAAVNAQLRVMGEDVRLPGSFEQTIFRIVQEALSNVRKHAASRNVEVLIHFVEDGLIAVVRDDGVGMDVPAVESRLEEGKNLGLISMREGAQLEKGTLEIRSDPGKGTEVRVSFTF